MRRYNDMIYFNISREFQTIMRYLENRNDLVTLDSILSVSNSLNMLNTRYIILDPNVAPVINPYALGNAWFVENIKWVDNPDEEVRAIKDIDAKSTAIIDCRFKKELSGKSFREDPQSLITLKSYAPNKMVYHSQSATEQLAVFSEIYYPKGWISKIDGKETPHIQVNYILRAMDIPAGNHEIVFEFKPESYEIGNKVSFASSILLAIFIAGIVFYEFRKRLKNSVNV